ncbi:MAG: hypothetical protein M5U34_11825 [Chloroflexi bacterium]|nr:hypothetical protein [Chloroflexota bacterium]
MKLEPKTRSTLRQVLERNITGLIQVINNISTEIVSQKKKLPLILIDDLDKPTLEKAKEIFFNHRETMLQPNCAIVYTVSSALFYSTEFEAIRDQAVFLPNIKLHERGYAGDDQNGRDAAGYWTMKMCVHQRMEAQLITEDALERAILYSGGVFRELARVMRAAIGQTRRRQQAAVTVETVERAAVDIRNEYRRILNAKDLSFYMTGISTINCLTIPACALFCNY